ncbi:MAG: hypothetical protein GY863_08805 [bacterium]|nr:hypothetical protein [bacterium]
MSRKINIYLFVVIMLLPGVLFAQFGKNKVQYFEPDWKYIQTSHFDVYYYPGGEFLAQFAADAIEKDLERYQEFFNYRIKKRIPLILYKSHNHFQQTNIIVPYMQEGILGVTESFKNRMVVPYEGSYEKFRHTLAHELVHGFINDMIYGSSVQSAVTGAVRLQLPMWFDEGLAEYMSTKWETRVDMIVRDASINSILGMISPYQMGHAFWKYIEEKYGQPKVAEILRKVNITKDVERGLTSAVGIEMEKLIEQLDLAVKRKYWPDIADRETPDEAATRLTDHFKDRHFYNISPAISPNGDKIAYITNRDDLMDIFLMSAVDGEIIGSVFEGQRAPHAEELHFLSPGMTWSPDGEYIAFAVKAGAEDALTWVNVDSKEINQKKFGLDGVFDADWSPDGDRIAFQGTYNGGSNIYVYNINTDHLEQLTFDNFSDHAPSWSPDGTKILFSSDRKDFVDISRLNVIDGDRKDIGKGDDGNGHNGNGNGDESQQGTVYGLEPEVFMNDHDYRNNDVYIMDADGSNVERLTIGNYSSDSPVWSPDGNKIAYTSEEHGISNISIMDLETRESYPITNLITGAFQLSWANESNKLAFTSYFNGGFDIFLLKDPLRMNTKEAGLKNTIFFDELDGGLAQPPDGQVYRQQNEDSDPLDSIGDLSKYIFNEQERNSALLRNNREPAAFRIDPSRYKDEDGNYKVNKYKLKFSPDVLTGNYAYDTFFGVMGNTLMMFSDMMGDHSIVFYTDLYLDLRNSNYNLMYFYQPRLTDYGIGIYNQSYMFTQSGVIGNNWVFLPTRLRNYGFQLMASRPVSKFFRIDANASFQKLSIEYLQPEYSAANEGFSNLRFNLNLIKDTVLWKYIGPFEGDRGSLSFSYSPPGITSHSFFTVEGDYRKYMRLNKEVSFALRLGGGFSEGKNPEGFFLGGVQNWINRDFAGGYLRNSIDDIFYTRWVDALRGSDYYELFGNRYGIVNAELRFPFIRNLTIGYPLSMGIRNVMGALFYDAGAAWVNSDFELYARDGDTSGRKLGDFRNAFGTGIRMVLGYFLLRYDVAWGNDAGDILPPKHYFSLGLDW